MNAIFPVIVEKKEKKKSSRFTVVRGYVLDKYIFRSVILLLVVLLCAAWISTNGLSLTEKKIHISCPYGSIGHRPCENPLYHNEVYRGRVPDELLEQETLPVGFNLNPPPFLVVHFGEIAGLLVVLAFILNDRIHNKGYDYKKNLKEIKKDVEVCND